VIEAVLTPEGHIVLREFEAGSADPTDAWLGRAANAFAASQAAGLFALAATRPGVPPPPSVTFWREFACRYLTELCRTPDFARSALDAIDPPDGDDVASLVLGAPPMPGGEYLSAEVIRERWVELDAWILDAVRASGLGLVAWLKKRASIWHQVGRVCFHLAENKRDSDYPFAFLATYAPRLSRGGRVQYQPLGKALEEYSGARNRKALIGLLAPVNAASGRSKLVKELVDSGDVFHPLAWTPRDAHRLLTDVPVLEESGLLVRVPDWWRKRARPRVTVTIGEGRQTHFGADAVLDFHVGVALGDDRLSESEWRRLMESDDGLVQIKGQWVEMDRERLAAALAHWRRVEDAAQDGTLSFIDGMRLLAGAPADLAPEHGQPDDEREWSTVIAGRGLSAILSKLRNPESIAAHAFDTRLRGTLRPYQSVGHDWLWMLSNLGLGACLADDMGLGKTIQILSLLLAFKSSREKPGTPSLLVLPASLLANWKSEIERFAPSLVTRFIHPSELAGAEIATIAEHPREALAGSDIIVTTYGMLLRQEWLLDLDWRLAILDEAQAIKNPAARQTKAVKRLRARARIALTGTPVENRLSDLWSLFDFLCPGLLGTAARFKRFVKGLEQREHDRFAPLRGLVRPYILRRLKTDKSIIADLPEKTEMKAFCGLTRKQVALYARSVEELRRALEERQGIERRGLVLASLMRLKQICNHPSQVLGDGRYDSRSSGKFERLRAICEEIASRQERALVFTQFREMTEPLATFLGDVFGRQGLVLHGATPVRRRKALVDMFQRDGGPPFLVLSLKAGGLGLNLTAASHVIHFDRWWNPAVETQATDRAFRIGQQRNVLVHKFVCRGTVEERIDALIEEKAALSSDLLETGAEARLTEMSNKELLAIVALDVDSASV
jgi:superfamily II DNA or RNA helicase